jgi:hypothetical protein
VSIITKFARLKKVRRCKERSDAAIFWTTLNLRDCPVASGARRNAPRNDDMGGKVMI